MLYTVARAKMGLRRAEIARRMARGGYAGRGSRHSTKNQRVSDDVARASREAVRRSRASEDFRSTLTITAEELVSTEEEKDDDTDDDSEDEDAALALRLAQRMARK